MAAVPASKDFTKMNISTDMTQLVGNTPLVFLNNVTKGCHAKVAVKLETANPLSSVKDRIALGMFTQLEREGKVKKGDCIVESTSGNTGIGLAWVAAVKGYKAKFVMPASMSLERRVLLKALGAEVILSDPAKGMAGANELAQKISSQPNHVWARQFENEANPATHFSTTGPEIYKDTNGQIDTFVAGVGTGGTITGTARFFKGINHPCEIIAVEPSKSSVLSGGQKGPHLIQGIGAGFIPDVMDPSLCDKILKVDDEDAIETAKRVAREEGIFCGISTGANISAAIKLAKDPANKGKLIVTVACDTGERYLSSALFKAINDEAKDIPITK
eukprot:TRINITY_DN37897_c0_g1_i1.p1 TRINITY_DN37897_c0_g1~~TRINITY_DN37897_c0_g1_i1.p1  ORF type:complete len:331 (+),score=117.18 TRINITY_DN37897_c0_g1_i1:77-1069(+)